MIALEFTCTRREGSQRTSLLSGSRAPFASLLSLCGEIRLASCRKPRKLQHTSGLSPSLLVPFAFFAASFASTHKKQVRSTMHGGQKGKTHEPRMSANSSKARGRMRGSWCQQRCISIHSLSVKAEWVGRGGRSPFTIASMAF